jgi:hypothetical protein
MRVIRPGSSTQPHHRGAIGTQPAHPVKIAVLGHAEFKRNSRSQPRTCVVAIRDGRFQIQFRGADRGMRSNRFLARLPVGPWQLLHGYRYPFKAARQLPDQMTIRGLALLELALKLNDRGSCESKACRRLTRVRASAGACFNQHRYLAQGTFMCGNVLSRDRHKCTQPLHFDIRRVARKPTVSAVFATCRSAPSAHAS